MALTPDSSTLEQKLQEVRSEFDLDSGNRMSGRGAFVLRQALAEAPYVLIGEDHFTREIPRFVAAVCDAMAADGGLTAMAVEAGPQAAKMVSSSLRQPDRVAQTAALLRQYPDSVAFLNDRQENDLVSHCAETSGRSDFQLWGIDQEFLGAAGWLLDQILATHPGPAATQELKLLKTQEQESSTRAAETGDPGKLFLLTAADAELVKAAEVLRREGTPQANELFRELIVSHEIYQKNATSGPDSNAERALLLKQNFQHDLDAIPSRDRRQRVLVKMGDWHLYKGFNPLHQRDLGNYIAEVADVQGVQSLHICVLGAKGTHSGYGGYRRPPRREPFILDQDSSYRWMKPAVDNQVTKGWTVYDLRKLRFQKIADLDPDFSRLIEGYDLLVIFPELSPAEMID